MYRGELIEDFVQAALAGGHGSATAVMMTLGREEISAEGSDDSGAYPQLWFLPGDIVAAAASEMILGETDDMLERITRLAVTYRPPSGEVLFRLSAERKVFAALGSDWDGLSIGRRKAWEVFGLVSNKVYDTLEDGAAEGATVTPPARIPAVAESIFDVDREPAQDPVRVAALQLDAADKAKKKGKGKKGKAAEAPAAAPAVMSAAMPAKVDLPPEPVEGEADAASTDDANA
ncbi:hypothetical protein [Ancylobacter oerskovii]|uniref:Uncharacterized protein n=1 Tax=Ancylobacter oerskovii TaxID=459519 RepID=A0ABW4YRD3_9HYPH|nr:hypothetical protein [Ancylobacter oerskovii]MBS7545677.1 hypothetical protein [Ancylobacter oerskovii]